RHRPRGRPRRARVPRRRALEAGAHPRPAPFRARAADLVNVHTDLSFVALVLQASVVVQAVMALLAFLSLWSWWQIFLKMFQIRRAVRDTTAFEDDFWKGGDLAELYQRVSQSRTGAGLEHIFTAGFRE